MLLAKFLKSKLIDYINSRRVLNQTKVDHVNHNQAQNVLENNVIPAKIIQSQSNTHDSNILKHKNIQRPYNEVKNNPVSTILETDLRELTMTLIQTCEQQSKRISYYERQMGLRMEDLKFPRESKNVSANNDNLRNSQQLKPHYYEVESTDDESDESRVTEEHFDHKRQKSMVVKTDKPKQSSLQLDTRQNIAIDDQL